MDKAVILACYLTVYDPFGPGVQDFSRDGHAPADDVVGNVEKAQRRAEVIGAESEATRSSLATGAQAKLAAILEPGVDLRDLPVDTLSQELRNEVMNLAPRSENQAAKPCVDLQRRF